MPSALTYPGVYIEEIPSGVHTIVGVATSITAFVGRAASGPISTATTINGFGDYERIFGGLSSISAMSYAVRDFFLNGGTQAVIVRLYHASAVAGDQDKSQFDVDTLTFEAADSGSWGANLRAFVDRNVNDGVATSLGLTDKTDLFNLTVFENIPGGLRETFRNLSVKPSPRRVDAVLNAQSKLVRWRGAAPDPKLVIPGKAILDGLATAATAQTTSQNKLDAAKQKLAALPKGATQAEKDAAQKDVDDATTQLATDTAALKTAQRKLTGDQAAGGVVFDKLTTAQNAGDAAAVTAAQNSLKASDGVALVAADFNPNNAQNDKTGLFTLDQVVLFNLLCIPPYVDDIHNGQIEGPVTTLATTYCEQRRAMFLVDPPTAWTDANSVVTDVSNNGLPATSANAAVYFPRLSQPDPNQDNQPDVFVPCGTMAGVYARTDAQRGVWKAPAGIDASLNGTPNLTVLLSDGENGQLHPLAVNCLRNFPIIGRVSWGARTTKGADILADDYKYVPVRRTALYIEQSLFDGLQWVVFEPNAEPLWARRSA